MTNMNHQKPQTSNHPQLRLHSPWEIYVMVEVKPNYQGSNEYNIYIYVYYMFLIMLDF